MVLSLRQTMLSVFACATLACSASVMADGNESSSSNFTSSSSQDSEYDKGYTAAMNGNYDAAIAILNKVVAKDPKHADAHNMLGYSYRKKGDYAASMKSYDLALRINPEHRGAHEYIGQAYLEQKNLAKAKEHLKRLDDICSWGCEEYDKLKRAVRSFETGRAPTSYGEQDRG